jgi:hypothetical protein
VVADETETQLGKSYTVEGSDDTVELLVTKADDGILTVGDVALVIKGAKPLPSSD